MDDDVEEVVFTPLRMRQERGPQVLVEYKDLAMQLTNGPQVRTPESQPEREKAKAPDRKAAKGAGNNAGHVTEKEKSRIAAERRVEARRPMSDKNGTRRGPESKRGASAQNLRSLPDTPRSSVSARSESRAERRKTTPTVTRTASATARLGSQTGVRRSRSQDNPKSAAAASQNEVDAPDLRSLQAQVASFRTRNAALEGEVAQLRAEAQVRKGQDEEIQRLRRELNNKDFQLQQKELEVKQLQAAAEQRVQQRVESFLRRVQAAPSPGTANPAGAAAAPVVGGSMTLPPRVTSIAPATPCTTPRVVPLPTGPPRSLQVFSPQPCQVRHVVGGEAPAMSFVTASPAVTHRVLPMTSASVRLAPRQVFYSPPATAR